MCATATAKRRRKQATLRGSKRLSKHIKPHLLERAGAKLSGGTKMAARKK